MNFLKLSNLQNTKQFEWEDVFLVAFESNVGERENVQCWWASLRYGDFLRLPFFLSRGRLGKVYFHFN